LYAVGHMSLGYILALATSKTLRTKMNIPIVLLLSVIPDIDILIPQLQHRGPAHSIIVATIIFAPLFAIYTKRASPYYVAFIQHSLIGDYFTGGQMQLLWPLTTQYYGLEISIRSAANITIEWTAFAAALIIMAKTGGLASLFRPRHSNLILAIPTSTVLLPTLLGFPLEVPIILVPPHIVYIAIFSASVAICLFKILKSSASRELNVAVSSDQQSIT